ncbi:uncharacterised conserved protein UCP033563, partial [Kipferlia bialata]
VEAPMAEGHHVFGVLENGKFFLKHCTSPAANVYGVVQPMIEAMDKAGQFKEVDYTHGDEVTLEKGMESGNVGVYLPTLPKSSFFKSVLVDGVLPCKSFSMGEADEKRFYLECRRILEQ